MGCLCTKERRIFEDPSMLSTQTIFTVKEVKTLNELYRKLGSTLVDDGFLNREEFKLGLFRNSKEKSLFADRMFDMFDSKHDGVIDFGEFVRSMSIFHPDTPQEEKAIFAFRLYDIWQTGFIEKEETFEEADSDKDGMIDIEEWKDLAVRRPTLLRNMTIPYLKDMTTFPSFTMRTEREDEINI
ncbi:calcineurin B-like protein 7 isoform X3 [Sesamum indicum]|uniref:Calcineurin B-like protein n=1 Tax=Sesamum indicum TaxID=4182 RepID=A0A6I9TH70_SESIN|nr:calcineurin B-like protein 7 isoform X3 [Sesamum indicum]